MSAHLVTPSTEHRAEPTAESTAPPADVYVVAVRALCEFTAKHGDLDLRFTPGPSARQGVLAHQQAASRRGAGYQAEVTLTGAYPGLLVRGRADGYDPVANRLDEIKSHRGSLDRLPDNHRGLHWAQARIYGWLLCQQLALPELTLALVYVDVDSGGEQVLTEQRDADWLRTFFESSCRSFLVWAGRELAHRQRRDGWLSALRFGLPDWRPGQRRLAEVGYLAARHGRCVLAQAPTGIGKTLASLFPLLKAAGPHKLDKIVFLTAKSSGRALALDALATLRGFGEVDHVAAGDPPFRVLELVARDKACEHPDNACFGDACPLARGFYDRLPAARQAAVLRPVLDKAAVREIALAQQICPYYLSQDLVRWVDVVVGDYNYWFDASAMLHGLSVERQWRVALLVDEAHNLVDRGRRMYTSELDSLSLSRVRKLAPSVLKKPLDGLARAWRALSTEAAGRSDAAGRLDATGRFDAAGSSHGAGRAAKSSAASDAYRVLAAPPAKWLAALHRATTAITTLLVEQPLALDPTLMRFYFDALQLERISELFGDDFLCEVRHEVRREVRAGARPTVVVCLRNIVPARLLGQRLATAHSALLFSATLTPDPYYRDTLGLPADAWRVDVPSAFDADQLSVVIADRISTRFRHRQQSIRPIVELIADQFARQPGNYLAFFSSHDYLSAVADHFEAAHAGVPVWRQAARQNEAQADDFLRRFIPGGQGIGFAVLGGAFAEGIDLPGDRLIGAFIATLGLPQVNPVNEQMRLRMQSLFGAGYDYTYLYPGLQKVVQAAGRVIRSPTDRGVVHLIDDRFNRPEVRRLLPEWWAPQG